MHGFRLDIACPDQPRETDPCARRDGDNAITEGRCVTCANPAAPPKPKPSAKALTAGQPTPPPEIAAALAGVKTAFARFALIDQIRQIAFNDALLSHKAVQKIRGLYDEFDAKHPQLTKGAGS